MRCPNCGFNNVEEAMYCKQCGNKLKGSWTMPEDETEEKGKMALSIVSMVISLIGWLYYLVSKIVGHFSEEIPGVLNIPFISFVFAALAMVLATVSLILRRTRKAGKVIAAIVLILSIVLFVLSIIAVIFK